MDVIIYTAGMESEKAGECGFGAIMEYVDRKGKQIVKEYHGGYFNTSIERMEMLACIRPLQDLKA